MSEMEKKNPALSFLILFLLLCPTLQLSLGRDVAAAAASDDDDVDQHRQQPQIYIVHVLKPAHLVFASQGDREAWHASFLPSPTLPTGEPRMVYSYEKAISGFAAWLTPEEVEDMSSADGFLAADPDEPVAERTTRTPGFLRLRGFDGLWVRGGMGEGIVVGVVDNGILPDHVSFNDDGMPEKPAEFNGTCDFGEGVCNRKLVAARGFGLDVRDIVGDHGTHVAGTAAGNFAPGAHAGGFACGVAAGAAPRAHLAFYSVVKTKVHILKGIDQAIVDGVDVINFSIGPIPLPDPSRPFRPFHRDPWAIGELSAVLNDTFVSVAAGNEGPEPGTLLDHPPWTLTVGAGSTDRIYRVTMRLGNGEVVHGEAMLHYHRFLPKEYRLVYPGMGRDGSVQNCSSWDMGGVKVVRKIVMCVGGGRPGEYNDNLQRVRNVKDARGVAAVLMNTRYVGRVDYNPEGYDVGIPGVEVHPHEAERLRSYVRSAGKAATMAMELEGGGVGGSYGHPSVARFSSRGPSGINNGVLKPDVIGPGVDILAASTGDPKTFRFKSGTSMAAPHLTGVAAVLKGAHRDWSPAMIKSAIMTTSDALDSNGKPITDEDGNPASLFAIGAGHVNAVKAIDPGLVYDLVAKDYVRYVCGLGYTNEQVNAVLRRAVDCDAEGGGISGEELNYPSFSVKLGTPASRKVLRRVVTNVGPASSSYRVSVEQPEDTMVEVSPEELVFTKTREKKAFEVTFVATNPGRKPGYAQGQLKWTSQNHVVRSPISITFAMSSA